MIVDGHKINLSRHALERYVERVKPSLDMGAALTDVAQLLAVCGTVTPTGPAWVGFAIDDDYTVKDGLRERASRWLLLGDDIAWPLVPDGREWRTITCIVRGGLSDLGRQRRNERRKKRIPKAARRTQQGGRPPRRDRGDWRAAA